MTAHLKERVPIDSDAAIREKYDGKSVGRNGEHERLEDALDILADLAEQAVTELHGHLGWGTVVGCVELSHHGARIMYVPIKRGGGYERGVPLDEALARLEVVARAAEPLFGATDEADRDTHAALRRMRGEFPTYRERATGEKLPWHPFSEKNERASTWLVRAVGCTAATADSDAAVWRGWPAKISESARTISTTPS